MTLRDTHIGRMRNGNFDTLIIGGGINGAVAAASLAGRGADVAIIDRGDWASFSSQSSSNLAWGGFKYLENYEFWLVYKLCRSRNRMFRAYPDNIKEIPFYAVLNKKSPYPPWFAFLGAFGYWIIGQFGTRRPRLISRRRIEREEPAINTASIAGGIEYHDGIIIDNDARFVFSFVRSAIEAGAAAANYVNLVSARRVGDRWYAELRDEDNGAEFSTTAYTIVNATGPFVDETNRSILTTTSGKPIQTDHRVVYSRGTHLVVEQLTTRQHDKVLAFYDDGDRLFYVIPMGRRSVIGTTDTRVNTPFTKADDDIDYLLGQINARLDLDQPLTRSDVIATRSGVRSLVVRTDGSDQEDADWTKLSRKHIVETEHQRGVITVFGGKLTDCINVGEEVADELEKLGIPLERDLHNWYGEPAKATRNEFFRQAKLMKLDRVRDKPNVEPLSHRLWRRYGRRAFGMLDQIRQNPHMAEDVMDSADYIRAELYEAADSEMVIKLEDFIRRRSKIDLVLTDHDIINSPGLRDVAEILFGDDANRRLAEFFGGEEHIPETITRPISVSN